MTNLTPSLHLYIWSMSMWACFLRKGRLHSPSALLLKVGGRKHYSWAVSVLAEVSLSKTQTWMDVKELNWTIWLYFWHLSFYAASYWWNVIKNLPKQYSKKQFKGTWLVLDLSFHLHRIMKGNYCSFYKTTFKVLHLLCNVSTFILSYVICVHILLCCSLSFKL